MKRMALLAASTLLVLPTLVAQDKPAPPKEPSSTHSAAPTATAPAAAPADAPSLAADAPAAGDSPLVALAKRSPKAPKKGTIVITNATLGGKNAKVTTTASQKPIATAAAPPEDAADANQVIGALSELNKGKEAAASKEKKAQTDAEKAKKMEALRARAEDDGPFDDGDPAQLEHQLEQSAQSKTQTQTQTAPPPKKP